jgi:hypothetical protein
LAEHGTNDAVLNKMRLAHREIKTALGRVRHNGVKIY